MLFVYRFNFAPLSRLPPYPSPERGKLFDVAAHLDAGPTGPPGKCHASRRPSPTPVRISFFWSNLMQVECFVDEQRPVCTGQIHYEPSEHVHHAYLIHARTHARTHAHTHTHAVVTQWLVLQGRRWN